jgi:hypothetical protein
MMMMMILIMMMMMMMIELGLGHTRVALIFTITARILVRST